MGTISTIKIKNEILSIFCCKPVSSRAISRARVGVAHILQTAIIIIKYLLPNRNSTQFHYCSIKIVKSKTLKKLNSTLHYLTVFKFCNHQTHSIN